MLVIFKTLNQQLHLSKSLNKVLLLEPLNKLLPKPVFTKRLRGRPKKEVVKKTIVKKTIVKKGKIKKVLEKSAFKKLILKDLEVEKPVKSKKFRLSGKLLFLTYSQIHPGLTKEGILEQLKKLINVEIREYACAIELHKDGGVHSHVFLDLVRRCNVVNPELLDLEYEGKTYHGNYQIVRNKKATLEYIFKNKDFIKSPGINVYFDNDGNLVTIEYELLRLSRLIGVPAALQYFIKAEPVKAVKSITKMESHLNTIRRVETVREEDL